MTPSLELRRVRASFTAPRGGRIDVLRGIDLTVPPGRVVALVGPSGSGKSTLLAVAGLLERPADGEVHVLGERVDDKDDRHRTQVRRDHIGVVFQTANLVPQLTALENVCLPALATRRRVDTTRARELLAQVGLSGREDHLPQLLSGGEAQRVACCRALLNEPALLLADEPTGSLDSGSATALRDLLRQVADSGVAVCIVTHDPATEQWADEALRLEEGVLVPRRSALGRVPA